jgi:hypothetical protein
MAQHLPILAQKSLFDKNPKKPQKLPTTKNPRPRQKLPPKTSVNEVNRTRQKLL